MFPKLMLLLILYRSLKLFIGKIVISDSSNFTPISNSNGYSVKMKVKMYYKKVQEP